MLITAESKGYDVQVDIEMHSAEGGLLLYYNEKSYSRLTVEDKRQNLYHDGKTAEDHTEHIRKEPDRKTAEPSCFFMPKNPDDCDL